MLFPSIALFHIQFIVRVIRSDNGTAHLLIKKTGYQTFYNEHVY